MLLKILNDRHKVINQRVEKIVYCYKEEQQKVIDFAAQDKSVVLVDNIDSIDEHITGENTILVLDDWLTELSSSYNKKLETLITRESHHKKIAVFVLVQNCYAKNFRTISLNSQYLAFFLQARDLSTIYHLARQVAPSRSSDLIKAYRRATSKGVGSYLFFDFTPLTDDKYRVRNSVFCNEDTEIYVLDENDY